MFRPHFRHCSATQHKYTLRLYTVCRILPQDEFHPLFFHPLSEGRTPLHPDDQPRQGALISPQTLVDQIAADPRILVIGPSYQTDRFLIGWHISPRAQRPFHALAPQLLADLRPEVVLSPLLAPDFDILDVADRLIKIGFGGRLVAVTGSLPDAAAVQNEVRLHCDGFQFDLLELVPDDSIPP